MSHKRRVTCIRFPRTTQERRASQEGWGRPRRNSKNMIEAWDDQVRQYQRCWKEYRKHHWKE